MVLVANAMVSTSPLLETKRDDDPALAPEENVKVNQQIVNKQTVKKSKGKKSKKDKTSNSGQKKVRFEKKKQTFSQHAEHLDVKYSDLWYVEKQTKAMKERFYDDSSDVASLPLSPEYESVTRTFAHCVESLSSADFSQVLAKFPSSTLMRDLSTFMNARAGYLGLERMTCRDLYREKHKRRRAQWKAVEAIQQQGKSNEETLLREACQAVSQPCVWFAHFTAVASVSKAYRGKTSSGDGKAKKFKKSNSIRSNSQQKSR
mmetsp:Transcript_14208/g.31028  ORF Transcript_14208/g.31028 Transcript_14208/m.31028 type:complete len:260 (-) Transcript_14208:104-883(-)|eukprot:CAMPEP_0168735782 /NCGR_PEP_ID=MMETSP0724-20121128/9517_1 /TAXON_ID=265536 /ORGANISM="Amphiprora sp., Strain CCMP467" /LENGTH=259 /DNA_ID=CAMNT_0008782949 /DNA_START=75 /DNA_END=854 /DNA_ORIENTATION=+